MHISNFRAVKRTVDVVRTFAHVAAAHAGDAGDGR